MHTSLPVPGSGSDVITLSVVSHGQGPMVERLITDLSRLDSRAIARLIVTRNLPDDPIAVPPNLPFEVQFIDNAGPRGFGANHNTAFARCETPWFAVLNPDVALDSDPFAPMLASASPEVGLVAPVVLETDGTIADSARPLVTPARLARRLVGADEWGGAAHDPDWYAAMFLMIRAEAFAAVDGFDERYFMYCEDVDLCLRLTLARWRLRQARAARVVHHAHRSSRRVPRYFAWHVASLLRLWTSRAFRDYRAPAARRRRDATRGATANREAN